MKRKLSIYLYIYIYIYMAWKLSPHGIRKGAIFRFPHLIWCSCVSAPIVPKSSEISEQTQLRAQQRFQQLVGIMLCGLTWGYNGENSWFPPLICYPNDPWVGTLLVWWVLLEKHRKEKKLARHSLNMSVGAETLRSCCIEKFYQTLYIYILYAIEIWIYVFSPQVSSQRVPEIHPVRNLTIPHEWVSKQLWKHEFLCLPLVASISVRVTTPPDFLADYTSIHVYPQFHISALHLSIFLGYPLVN